MKNEIIRCFNEDYKALEDADMTEYRRETYYAAKAIWADAKPDEDGAIPVFLLLWEIPQVEADDMPDSGEYADLIDWDHPDDVIPFGGEGNQYRLNPETGRIG